MSSINKTPHYNLSQFGDSPDDKPSWRGDYTADMSKIDLQMYRNATDATTATSIANTAKTTADSALSLAQSNKADIAGDEEVVEALLGDNTVDAATIAKIKWDKAGTDAANIMRTLAALGADTVKTATWSKDMWDKASTDAAKAVTDAATATAKATANTEALTALKDTIDTHTTAIAGIKNDYATNQYVNSTFLKHSNIAVAKISNADFTIYEDVTTPAEITFDEPDGRTSFDDEDGVISLSALRDHMTVSRDGIYLISAEARFGGITFTDEHSYRGLELLLYVNDDLMATAPAAMVAGANGSIRGAQYSAFPCRPYKLTANDEISLKYRLNGPTSEISGKISYCTLSMFRVSKH